MTSSLTLSVLPETLTVCRLAPTDAVPAWALRGDFFNVVRTSDELSIVCASDQVPEGVRSQPDWRALKVEGPLDFALMGILAALSTLLADAGVSIFAISTFDTDYILVQQDKLQDAVTALRSAGHALGL